MVPMRRKIIIIIIIIIMIMIINGTYEAQNLPKNSERTKNKKIHKNYEFAINCQLQFIKND